jgi:YVTN family beta-propeller protein
MRIALAALLSSLAMLVGAPAATSAAGVPFCVVSNLGSNTASVIDASATPPNVSATVPVGGTPQGVAISPDGKTALVTNAGDGTVSFISTSTNSIVATAAVGANPNHVAVTPNGALAYVTNVASHSVSVIDLATRTVRATVQLPVASSPAGVAISPDSSSAYITDFQTNAVFKVDTATDQVVATLGVDLVGSAPEGVAVDSTGTKLYVAETSFRSLRVINLVSQPRTVTAVTLADFPAEVALSPDGTHLVVSELSHVQILDTATNTVGVAAQIPLGGPFGVAVSADGNVAYITNQQSSVYPITVPGGTVGDAVTVGSFAFGIACGVKPPAFLAMTGISPSLAVDLGPRPGQDRLAFAASLTLGAGNNGIDPIREGLNLELNSFSLPVPAAAIVNAGPGLFTFTGTVNGANVVLVLQNVTASTYRLGLAATGANLRAITNPTTVRVTLGDDQGTATVTAKIRR